VIGTFDRPESSTAVISRQPFVYIHVRATRHRIERHSLLELVGFRRPFDFELEWKGFHHGNAAAEPKLADESFKHFQPQPLPACLPTVPM
jgi:hypothetical protein